jgi:serine/threonine protein kinase
LFPLLCSWSLGITAYELAIGEPPHAKLHSMRAAIKIPTSPPPTLPEPERFSPDFHSFLAACLVKDFEARPSAATLLTHPFILRAPPESILMDNVRAAMLELESKHESIDEINGLMGAPGSGANGGPGGVRPSSQGSADKRSLRGVGGQSQSSNRMASNAVSSGDAVLDSTHGGSDDVDFDDDDFDNLVEGGFSGSDTIVPANLSDTMVQSGAGTSATMVPINATTVVDSGTVVPLDHPAQQRTGGARPLPPSNRDNDDTINYGTIVPTPSAAAARGTTVAAGASAATAANAAAPPAAAASAAAKEDSTEDAIQSFADEDSDDDELPELRITEEHE